MPNRSAIASFTEIATLRIELVGSDPLIWRVVEVPTSITLKVLHDIVQVSMGWCDFHLWQMMIGGKTYGLSVDEDFGIAPRKLADRVRLRDVLTGDTTHVAYIYDFGDSWEHSLVVSDIRTGAPDIGYPRFVAGQRDCPPEDCGGLPGFYEMLEARDHLKHPDHAHVVEWLDGYDPEELDIFPIEVALGRIAARRNAAAKRIMKTAEN
jgi:hypothetical protein